MEPSDSPVLHSFSRERPATSVSMYKHPTIPHIGTPEELQAACQGILHPKAIEGIALFDAGEYWRAHEALEEAWLEEAGTIRHLYRGILQAGVCYLHVQRANYRGAWKLYWRARRWLDPFPQNCRGLDIGQLKSDLDAVMAEVRRLGPDRIAAFDPNRFKPIQWSAPGGEIQPGEYSQD